MKRKLSAVAFLALFAASAVGLYAGAMACGNASTGHSVWCHEHWYGTECSEFDQNGAYVGPGGGLCGAWADDAVMVKSW
jgi:hypothetical protein